VESVVVFGSYLSGAKRLNDLDIAVELRAKWHDNASFQNYRNASLDRARARRRRFRNLMEEVCWPQLEVVSILKNRSRTISFCEWNSLLLMEGLCYCVVFGDRRISGKLKWPTLRAKLYRPGPDTVEQVAAKGRSSGESHEQKREGMNSTKKTARIAGLLYLVNGVTGFFSIIYVPIRLIVSGNAAATATTFSLPRGFSASASSQN
jgi:hypothetical protein